MSKQEHLISADKLKEWFLNNDKAEPFMESEYSGDAFVDLCAAIDSGLLNPDPVPTIKPGDKVRYHGWQYNLSNVATVDHLIERNGTYATIIHDEAPYIVPLEHLEVVKDE
ncbi:hypothetical protein TCA2_4418 [Paenibacillus sp. TCA20]|uniref:Phage protein n=1 Tax=Paenibacillus urinalis TaxID=521520 RepID=A0ABY7XHC8_9BACL|nr:MULTISPECIES: hypothetical protein [Paenibacillus]WDI05242.1 hypothetical protein PUW25_25880 [Paenibacillus urinalis]GAK41926.1 hypothetical protein TCA2_4418 [Paenibacillus sp. TCA20]